MLRLLDGTRIESCAPNALRKEKKRSEMNKHNIYSATFEIRRVELMRKIRATTLLGLNPVKSACNALIPYFGTSSDVVLSVGILFDICSLAHAIDSGDALVRGDVIYRKAEQGEVAKPGDEYYIKTSFNDLQGRKE